MINPPLSFSLTPEESHQPLAAILRARFGPDAELPLARGGVWLSGRRVADATQPAPANAEVVVRRPPAGHYTDVDVNESDILYEDAWLLALNKRAGWYSVETPWDTWGNVVAGIARFLAQRDGQASPHLAHRLDRDTSGVLLVSRDPRANAPLQRAFAERTAHKQYWCVCAGVPSGERFSLCTGHGRGAGGRFQVYPFEEIGRALPGGNRVKEAHTDFTLIERLDDAALLVAEPRTGRSHQIRLHLAALGHPLLGDIRYGGPAQYAGRALPFHLLHAARLELPHPITDAPLVIEAPLPEHFAAITMS